MFFDQGVQFAHAIGPISGEIHCFAGIGGEIKQLVVVGAGFVAGPVKA